MENSKIDIEVLGFGKKIFNSKITPKKVKKLLKIKKEIFLIKFNNSLISWNYEIKDSGKLEFIFDYNNELVWNETNKFVANFVYDFLKKKINLGDKIGFKINENGFILDFYVKENISKNDLFLYEKSLIKEISKLENNYLINTSLLKYFKFIDVSGLEIKEKSKKANRIIGFASMSKINFDEKLNLLNEREAYDHRKLGKELELFFIDEMVGKGLPIWLPDGVTLKNKIKDFILKKEDEYNYLQVETPILGSLDFYKTSGHYEHYKASMFPKMKIEEKETFILRPMACPHHVMVFKHKLRSYKDLPIRFAEHVKQFRYEFSGSLIGLERVRAMELTDAHIFLREDQLLSEIKNVFEFVKSILEKFKINIYYIELALHDKKNTEKYHGDKKMWERSEKILKNFLDSEKIDYVAKEGEAAFYGPKIDIQIKTSLGHIITVSTIQLDFFLPENFDISYIDKDNKKVRPVMIHRGAVGTYERFISILLEQYKGNFPMWLAPKQAVIIPINNEKHLLFSKKIYNLLKENNVRVFIDDSNERLSNKIRLHQTSKVKTQIIIGDDEISSGMISYRFYGDEKINKIKREELASIYKTNI